MQDIQPLFAGYYETMSNKILNIYSIIQKNLIIFARNKFKPLS